MNRVVRFLFLLSLFCSLTETALARPVRSHEAKKVGVSLLNQKFPSDSKILSNQVIKVSPLREKSSSDLLGYVIQRSRGGFVLLSRDTQAPPYKLYSQKGRFSSLPPELRKVLALELKEDLYELQTARKRSKKGVTSANYHLLGYEADWASLLGNGRSKTSSFVGKLDNSGSEGLTLLRSTWDQGSPYNLYAPNASGGPGGRAWSGCTATALSQILRYHSYPAQISVNDSYTDSSGSCTGSYNLNSYGGLGAYSWSEMPMSLSGATVSQQQAVARLIQHASVALHSNFEGSGTSAYPSDVPDVVQTFFDYSSSSYDQHNWHPSSSEWYGLIKQNVDRGLPLFYAMWQADWSGGHAVVCDGYRNGNEIHLNLGWSGYYNAWYNIDTVSVAGVYNWTIHGAVFNISPRGAPVLSVSPAGQSFGSVGVGEHPTVSFQVTNFGSTTLTGSVAVSAPFSVDSGASYTLAPSASQVVVVGIDSSVIGTSSGSITFTGGAGSSRSLSASVVSIASTPTATVTGTPTSTPTFTATPAATQTATPSPADSATPEPDPREVPTVAPTPTFTITPTITVARADLRPIQFLTSKDSKHYKIAVRGTVLNSGNATSAANVKVTFISVYGNGKEKTLGTISIGKIVRQTSARFSTTLSVPSFLRKIPFVLREVVDPGNVVVESDERNNSASRLMRF